MPEAESTADEPEAGYATDLAAAVGHTIRVIRTDQGLSRRELADKAGISYSYLSAIENGTKPPSAKTQMGLAGALGLRVHELLELAESSTRSTGPAARRWMQAGAPPNELPERHVFPERPLTRPRGRRGAAYLKPRAELTQLLAELANDDVELLLELARKLAGRH